MMLAKQKQRLIVGLGNPGKEYELTRHNLGYLVVQGLAKVNTWEFKEQKTFQALAVKGLIENEMVHLLLPTTYMNLSGKAVKQYMDYYKITPSAVLVIADDVDLPFGEMRLRQTGSAGGHNGLKSIEYQLGTQDYARLRMGIGQKHANGVLADHVLGRFTQEEYAALAPFIQKGVNVVMRLMAESFSRVMSAVNAKSLKKEPTRPVNEGQENKNEST